MSYDTWQYILSEVFEMMNEIRQAAAGVDTLDGVTDALRQRVGTAAEHADFGNLPRQKIGIS